MDEKKDVSHVWVVDDDEHFCQFLRDTFEQQARYQVLGVSNTLSEAKRDLVSHQPDLITIDLSLPDGTGVDLIAWLQHQMPHSKKIILSFWGQDDLVFDAFRQGADGYLQKDQLLTMELHNAIDAIEQGGTPISPKIAKKFLQFFSLSLDQRQSDSQIPNLGEAKVESVNMDTESVAANDTVLLASLFLSDREVEVLQLLTKGYNYKEISKLLNISFNTVCTHVKHVYRKIKVTSKTEALIEAQKNKWFKL